MTCSTCVHAKPEPNRDDGLLRCECLQSMYYGCTTSPEGKACEKHEARK